MINTIPCTPGRLPGLLDALYKLRFSAFIWGEPGVGKSETIQQWSKDRGMRLTDVRLTQMDAPDLRGLQWISEKDQTTVSYRPEFFPTENVPGVIFLDELTAAEPRMQATAYQLVLDKRVGPHILPEKWMVLGAGNSPEDGAISYKMGSALSDRFVHIHVEADPMDWINWALENNIHVNVISFMQVKPQFLTSNAGQSKADKLICPSPRSWAKVSKILFGVSDKITTSILINGIVGEAAAVEFQHTCEEIADLPSMASLLAMPSKKAAEAVPNKIACYYGLAYSMAAYVKEPRQISDAMLIFDALRKKKSDMPAAEIETLANEMLLSKAVKDGTISQVVRTEGYINYAPRAKQVTST